MTLAVKEPSNNIVIESLQTEKHNEEKADRSAVHFLMQILSELVQRANTIGPYCLEDRSDEYVRIGYRMG